MARHLFRNLALSGAAALSFATVTTPSTNETLSNQRGGNAAASEASLTRLEAEGRSLAREYQEIDFQATSLQKAQEAIAAQKDPLAQVRALEAMNKALQDRIAARDERTDKFHTDLRTDRNISEADAQSLYTNALQGEKYAFYYQERMAYRDECKGDTACMERMDDSEGARKFASFATRTGTVFGGTLGLLFGLSALGGAAGNLRRRRAEDDHRARLAEARDMLKPKNG